MNKFFFEKKDFLQNPYIVRQYALSRQMNVYDPKEKSIWSGLRFDIPIQEAQELALKVQDCFDTQIKLNTIYFNLNSETSMHGFPHKDCDDDNFFSGVVYLNDLTDTNAGTTLYEDYESYQYEDYLHKMEIVYSTSISKNNSLKEKFSQECLEFKKNLLQEVVSFNFEFNKMVCYSSNYLHSSNFYFGENKRSSRLTIEFFGEFNAN